MGIVFAGFQARGSIKESLIFCYHKYSDNDRDREFFSDIDNIDIIIKCIKELSAEDAVKILVMYKRLWYLYPKERYGYNSYYTVIKNLIFKIEEDRELVDNFNRLYPKLLYAKKIMPSDKRLLKFTNYKDSTAIVYCF